MYTLLLMRHAKSSWDNPTLSDRERPLAPRGLRDGSQMGRFLISGEILPAQILCSPTVRTRQTLQLLLDVFPSCRVEKISISHPAALYEGSVIDLIELVRQCERSIDPLLLIGHNPLIRDLTASLTGKEFPHPKFSTAAIAILELHIEKWSAADRGCARLIDFVRPKNLADG